VNRGATPETAEGFDRQVLGSPGVIEDARDGTRNGGVVLAEHRVEIERCG
jgi:hypothetical protein